jgi:hypothetical protein
MNEMLQKRIERHLQNLTDEQGYQLLDFVEFLESKYGTATRQPTTFERFTDGVEDALRAGRIPAAAIRETMHAVDSASRLMQRLAEAGRGAVQELNRSLAESEGGEAAGPDAEGPATPPASDRAPDVSAPVEEAESEPPAPA